MLYLNCAKNIENIKAVDFSIIIKSINNTKLSQTPNDNQFQINTYKTWLTKLTDKNYNTLIINQIRDLYKNINHLNNNIFLKIPQIDNLTIALNTLYKKQFQAKDLSQYIEIIAIIIYIKLHLNNLKKIHELKINYQNLFNKFLIILSKSVNIFLEKINISNYSIDDLYNESIIIIKSFKNFQKLKSIHLLKETLNMFQLCYATYCNFIKIILDIIANSITKLETIKKNQKSLIISKLKIILCNMENKKRLNYKDIFDAIAGVFKINPVTFYDTSIQIKTPKTETVHNKIKNLEKILLKLQTSQVDEHTEGLMSCVFLSIGYLYTEYYITLYNKYFSEISQYLK
jgi:hypothetical protein